MEYNKERYKKYFFEYNGEYSYDYYIDIINSNHMDSPAPIIEQVRVPGASRDTIYSEGTYENKVIDIECYVDIRHDIKRKEVHIKRLKQWLNKSYDYKKLRFSDDNGFYEGVCISNMLFEEVVEGLYKTLITFSCAPYKMKQHKDYIFNYKVRELDFKNEGFIEAPFKIKIEYPVPEKVYGFNIQVINTKFEIVYHFICDAPIKNTKYIDINSEDFNMIATHIDNTKSSAVGISKGFVFPYALIGDNKIRVNFNCDDEASYPITSMTFRELEI